MPPAPAPVAVTVKGIAVREVTVLVTVELPSVDEIVTVENEFCVIVQLIGSATVIGTGSDHSDSCPDADVTFIDR